MATPFSIPTPTGWWLKSSRREERSREELPNSQSSAPTVVVEGKAAHSRVLGAAEDLPNLNPTSHRCSSNLQERQVTCREA